MFRFMHLPASGLFLMTAVAVAALDGAVGSVRAQSMDYGALEQLFGEPVTTSVIGSPQRARDVPADMEIVTADDIRRSGAIDIPGVLSHVLGVDVQRWSALGADISVRGYDSPMSPRTLVLIDGRQVYNDDFGRTEWAALPVELSEIRQIEIVKGPNSALFGFNAAGGVINIITFNPLYDKVNTASVTGGSQGYRQASAVGTAQFGDVVGMRLSAGVTQSNDYASIHNMAASEGLPSDTARNQISADVHWRIDARSELELQATHGEDHRLSITPAWVPIFLHDESNSLLARYSADTPAGVVSATAYSNWSYDANRAGSPQPTDPHKNQLTVATLQDVFQPGADQTVRITTEFRHSSITTVPTVGGVVSYDVGSLGGMWNWNVVPSLSLTAAVRADALWLSRTGGALQVSTFTNADWSRQLVEPSYNLGAVWHPAELDRFRLTIARGVQLPSLLNLGGFQDLSLGYSTLSGNPNLDPTIVDNYEIGWDHDLPMIQSQSKIAVFYQMTRNIQSFVSPFGVTVTPQGGLVELVGNIGNSDEVGAEFSLKGKLAESWRWQVSYSPRLVRDKYKSGATIANTGTDFADTTPQHVGDVSLGWSEEVWEADAFLRVQSSASGLFIQPGLGYAVATIGPTASFDCRIAYRVGKNVTLSLDGQNVLFSSPRQTVFGKVEQQVLGSITVNF